MTFTYPDARRADTVDIHHGRAVADPYRWLEDPHSPETIAFVAAQNAVTMPYLEALATRDGLHARMTELWDVPRTGTPTVRNGTAVWTHNDGLQDQPVYMCSRDDGEPRLLLDPNSMSDDGTVAVVVTSLSPDGRHFAYTLAEAGSDRQRLSIRSTETGEDLADELLHLRFTTIAWYDDGFFYARFPETDPASTDPVRDPSVYFHRLGDPQDADRLVFHNDDDPEPGYAAIVTHDDAYLVLLEHVGTSRHNGVLYLDLRDPTADWTRLVAAGEATHQFVHHHDGGFIFFTDRAAPNGRIVRIPLSPSEDTAVLVPEADSPMEGAAAFGGELIALRLDDGAHRITRHALDGTTIGELPLPGHGSVDALSGRFQDTDVYIGYQSFLDPPIALRWDGTSTATFAATDRPIDRDEFVVERHQATSSDGRSVGMFVIRPAGATGPGPVEMYGYGGFSVNLTPSYSPARLAFLEAGGTVVVTNLRGSLAKGEVWHAQGMLEHKQQVFDDFIACGEHLIEVGITTSAQLGIRGGSNGGLLTAAVMIQRPDLFGAVVSQVPVTDMLRYQHFTAGRYWTVEYGDAADPDAFDWLIAYSPLHNVGDASTYPPLLITTAESDDRVVPMHAHKFAATVQHEAGGSSPQPLLLRVETKAGHGLGKPTSKVIDESADVYAFLLENLRA